MRQNLTVRLDDSTVRKAKVLAARRSTSVSRLVADEIDRLVREDEAYEQARVEALGELDPRRTWEAGATCRHAVMCMTAEHTFVDTNVLLHAHDRSAGHKHDAARDLLVRLWGSRTGVLSTQVLQEFYVNGTWKLPQPLTAARARLIIVRYATWPVHRIDPGDIVATSELEKRHRLSFWDALVTQRPPSGRVHPGDRGSAARTPVRRTAHPRPVQGGEGLALRDDRLWLGLRLGRDLGLDRQGFGPWDAVVAHRGAGQSVGQSLDVGAAEVGHDHDVDVLAVQAIHE